MSMSWWEGAQFSGQGHIDLNDNGTPDIPVFLSTDPVEFGVVDGGSPQVIWSIGEEALMKLGVHADSITGFTFRSFIPTGETAMFSYIEGGAPRFILLNAATLQPEPGTWEGLGRVVWANSDFNGDGFVDLITAHNGIVTALSGKLEELCEPYLQDGPVDRSEVPPPMVTTSGSQEVVLKFESDPSSRLPMSRSQLFAQRSLDINQDGITDLVIVREDPQDGSLQLTVVNMKNGEVMWAFDIPDGDEDVTGPFHGFHDVNADGTPEAYFGERVIVNQQGEVSKLPEGFVIVGFQDIDDDGFEDLWGYRKQDSVVQIWGASQTSSVRERAPAAQFNLDIRPNLVAGSTQIHYHLSQPATVVIRVHDLSGQASQTLFHDRQTSGAHSMNWNAGSSGLPPGLYVVSLSADGSLETRKVVLVN